MFSSKEIRRRKSFLLPVELNRRNMDNFTHPKGVGMRISFILNSFISNSTNNINFLSFLGRKLPSSSPLMSSEYHD